MSELRLRFGKRLRQIRRSQDLTQAQLAERAGLSIEFLSFLERGVHGPSFDTIEKLSSVLDVDPSAFFIPLEKKGG